MSTSEREGRLREALQGLFDAEELLSELSPAIRTHSCRGCWASARYYQRVTHEPGCPVGNAETALDELKTTA